jgi:signal transduction histidine kinase
MNETPLGREVPRPSWLAVAAPLLALWLAAEIVHTLLGPRLPWPLRLLASAGVLAAAVAIHHRQVMRRLEPLATRLRRQNEELLALHHASLEMTAELDLDAVLQTIVEGASTLLRTRYGALTVFADDGNVTSFVTTGVPAELHERLGAPRGLGLLGVPLRSGERLRLDDVASEPRATGFPVFHPTVRTLLAVPIPGRGRPHGNLYLSERADGSTFTAEDEETLVRFAQQAKIAIDNAMLHQRTLEIASARERLRLASGLYDGTAQVLAYVNTKTQVVREHIRQGRTDEALQHLDQLAANARDVYAGHRARILDLKALDADRRPTAVEAIDDHLRAWSGETAVEIEAELPADVDIAPEVELQLLRILQEGLDNVRRHSHASLVRVALRQADERILLELADNGVGFDPEGAAATYGSPHLGLPAMKERATAMGGRLEVQAAPGAGTRLLLELPAEREGHHAAGHR